MTTTYVNITREEFEHWLNSSFNGRTWELRPNTAGVYLLHVSDNVSVQINSSIASKGASVRYAKASMTVRLVSRLTGRTLNKKANTTSHTKRTAGWRQNLKAAVDRMIDEHGSKSRFYNFIALPEDKQGEVRDRQLAYLRAIYAAARKDGDTKSMAFCHDVAIRIKNGWIVNDKVGEAIKRGIAKYRIPKIA